MTLWDLFDFTGADGAENFERLEGISWAGSSRAYGHDPRGLLGFVSLHQPSKGLVSNSSTKHRSFYKSCSVVPDERDFR